MVVKQRTPHPEYLVDTAWLAAHLFDPELRVFDCTTYLDPDPVETYVVRSGRDSWAKQHIPGANHIDIQGELSEPASPFRFTLPSAAQFASAMAQHGVGDDSRVVLYCTDRVGWATRVWWLLRVFGFDRAAVLDGGLNKWIAEGRPTTSEVKRHPRANFTARLRPELVADKGQVRNAIGDKRVCVVNSLTEPQFTGEGGAHYGRPGRIAGSVLVSARALVDDNTNAFRPLGELAAMFEKVGADQAERVITYCGGGIAASADAFALAMLGYDNVALYDGSLSEWTKDPTAPMETGQPA